MSSAKKIGLFACTGVVAGNMMGSGIALLPANFGQHRWYCHLGLGNFNYWCDVSGLCLCPTGH